MSDVLAPVYQPYDKALISSHPQFWLHSFGTALLHDILRRLSDKKSLAFKLQLITIHTRAPINRQSRWDTTYLGLPVCGQTLIYEYLVHSISYVYTQSAHPYIVTICIFLSEMDFPSCRSSANLHGIVGPAG